MYRCYNFQSTFDNWYLPILIHWYVLIDRSNDDMDHTWVRYLMYIPWLKEKWTIHWRSYHFNRVNSRIWCSSVSSFKHPPRSLSRRSVCNLRGGGKQAEAWGIIEWHIWPTGVSSRFPVYCVTPGASHYRGAPSAGHTRRGPYAHPAPALPSLRITFSRILLTLHLMFGLQHVIIVWLSLYDRSFTLETADIMITGYFTTKVLIHSTQIKTVKLNPKATIGNWPCSLCQCLMMFNSDKIGQKHPISICKGRHIGKTTEFYQENGLRCRHSVKPQLQHV